MVLFGNVQIVGRELQRCLAYYEAELRVTTFQTRESDLFNNFLVKYLNSMTENPMAAWAVLEAANRLVQAAEEVIKRHEEIKPIPEAASSMHCAWKITYLEHVAWAKATLSATEALANGMKPNYAYVQDLLERCQSASCKAQREDKKFLKRLQVTPDVIEKMISLCNDAIEDDDWKPKPIGFDSRNEEKTKIANTYFEVGCRHIEKGHYDEAVESLKCAVKLMPTDEEALMFLAVGYKGLGDFEKAISVFKKAIHIKADYAQAYYNLGLIYQDLQRYEEAMKCYKEAISIEPDYELAHNNIGAILIELGQYEQGIKACMHAIELNPDFSEAYYNLASAYFRIGDYSSAADACKRLIQIVPNHPYAQKLLAVIEEKG